VADLLHPTSADVAVIGAGVWGLTAAWLLAADGASVVLVDDGGAPTADVAAGMLCPWSEHEDDGEHAFYGVLRRSAAGWPAFAARVEAASGLPSGFHRCGSVYVAARPEHLGAVRRVRDTLARNGRPEDWQDADRLADVEPGLGPAVSGGIALDDEHQADPPVLVEALREAARRAGVALLAGTAAVANGGLRVGDRDIHAVAVVNAAGHAAGRLSRRVPVRPVKGQILTLAPRPDHPSPLRRMVRTPSCYLVPRPDGRVVVGATQEERGDRDVTAVGVLDLLDDALRISPELAELRLAGTAAGLRPATADLRPAIGADQDGLVWATGGFRHGVLLLPAAGPAIAAAARGETVPDDIRQFDPGRFA
jgi:glycine oxidase